MAAMRCALCRARCGHSVEPVLADLSDAELEALEQTSGLPCAPHLVQQIEPAPPVADEPSE